MSYGNGQRVAQIYSDTEYTSSKTQGPVVTFNLLRSDGTIIGYSEVFNVINSASSLQGKYWMCVSYLCSLPKHGRALRCWRL